MRKKSHKISRVLLSALLFSSSLFAQRGKDGTKTVVSPSAFVNEFTNLTVNAPAGSSSIRVSNSNLNSAGLFSSPLSAGDLILIVQMQGATMKVATDSTYGNILNYNNCGNYEFSEVASVPNLTTIQLNCPLQLGYTASGKVQVVRVPRYTALTINGGASVTCPAWNGSTGGVVAIEVLGNTVFNDTGKIDVSGKGFRGGILNENMTSYGVDSIVGTIGQSGAEKGEGISGFESVYDALGGRYCHGAPANGGGGGNAHNSGGGGGANGGDLLSWTGKGCPDVSDTNWIAGWNLEYNGFASSTSSGGGRGGYTYSAVDENALLVGPFSIAWGGDYRANYGGLGGRPLDYSGGKLFMGGGGGAGDQNDDNGGAGGNGGGLIYLLNYGTVSGNGQLIANGANGSNTTGNGKDGSGGGGAGGTIILNSSGAVNGIAAIANGGNGGSQTVSPINLEAEGPGGGGGGGYIALSNGFISSTANGGKNGTTNSTSLTEMPSDGATKGGIGTNNATISNFTLTTNDVTICAGSQATLNVGVAGVAPPGTTFNWYDSQTGGTLVGTGNTFITQTLSSSTDFFVGSCPGTYRQAIHITVDVVLANFSSTPACQGTATVFSSDATSSGAGISSWDWNFGDGSANSSVQNPVHIYLSADSFTVVLTVQDSLGCTNVVTQDAVVNPNPIIAFASADTNGCGQIMTTFSNQTLYGSTYTWNLGDGGNSTQPAPSHLYVNPGTYTVTLSSISTEGCVSTDSAIGLITVNPLPIAAFTVPATCFGDTVYFLDSSNGNGSSISAYHWNFGDSTGTSTVPNPSYYYPSAGSFSAQVVVENVAGCNDTANRLVVVKPLPVVSFTPDVTNGCGTLTVNFSNTTAASPAFVWNFGDGDTTQEISPAHTYSVPGSYTVILKATLSDCSDADTLVNMITVKPLPMASFTVMPVCQYDSVHFLNASTGNGSPIMSYLWDFGDTSQQSSQVNPAHHYAYPGSFIATLTVTDSLSCTDTVTQAAVIFPSPDMNFIASSRSACDSLTVYFSNSDAAGTTHTWYFGDGGTSGLFISSHQYTMPGAYTVALTATTPNGCTRSVAVLNMIAIHESPVANFSATQTNFCANQCIGFNDSSAGPHTLWTWSFPGATPSSSGTQNPSNICYQVPGSYPVTLTTSSNFCSSVKTVNNYITVVGCSQPVADFASSDTSICNGSCLNFINKSTNATALQWLFPGASPVASTDTAPGNICYNVAGNYDVTLIASNSLTNDTLFLPGFIHVFTSPQVPSIVQNGDTLTTSIAAGYQWYYNTNPVSGSNHQQHLADLPGYYSVEITDSNGCSAISLPYHVLFVGTDETSIGNTFFIYPNPVSDQLNFQINSTGKGPLRIRLENVVGELITEKSMRQFSGTTVFSFDVSSFSAGVYFIRVETPTVRSIQKFIKE